MSPSATSLKSERVGLECQGRWPDGPGSFGGRMTDSSKNKAGYVAAEVMARAGIRRLYTVPGESFLEILDAAEEHPDLDLISTRHESGASFMAEAEGKLT